MPKLLVGLFKPCLDPTAAFYCWRGHLQKDRVTVCLSATVCKFARVALAGFLVGVDFVLDNDHLGKLPEPRRAVSSNRSQVAAGKLLVKNRVARVPHARLANEPSQYRSVPEHRRKLLCAPLARAVNRWVDDQDWRGPLVHVESDDVVERFRLAHLLRHHPKSFLHFVRQHVVEHGGLIRKPRAPILARLGRCPARQDSIPVRPFRNQ